MMKAIIKDHFDKVLLDKISSSDTKEEQEKLYNIQNDKELYNSTLYRCFDIMMSSLMSGLFSVSDLPKEIEKHFDIFMI